MQTIVLIGAEEVRRAASEMTRAAETMRQAAFNMEGTFDRHQRFLEDWLATLRLVVGAGTPDA